MIYRAVCYSTHERMSHTPESWVFIQGGGRQETKAKLCRMLGELWDVPPDTVEMYNFNDEKEILAQAFGGDETGDARFFESGFANGQPTYMCDDPPLLLLRPEVHKRFMAARARLCRPRLKLV